MKIEIRCPACNKGYLIDEELLGSALRCPACSTAIVVRVAPARKAAAATVSAAAGGPGGAATGTLAPAATGTAPQAGAAEEVVCPRCQLHFVPRRGAVRSAEGCRPKVLVVEDNAFFREVAADALGSEYEVISADSAAEARTYLARGDIDLMILDLTLDGPDSGLELMRSLPTKPCPVLIFTARDESEMYGDSWDELRKLGADDMVLKGMNAGELLVRKVGTLLGKRWEDED